MKYLTLIMAFGVPILTVLDTRVGIACAAPGDSTSDADGKAEAAKYQGVWRSDSYVQNGKPQAKKDRGKMTVKFDEDRFTLRHDGSFHGCRHLETGRRQEAEGDYTGLHGRRSCRRHIALYLSVGRRRFGDLPR